MQINSNNIYFVNGNLTQRKAVVLVIISLFTDTLIIFDGSYAIMKLRSFRILRRVFNSGRNASSGFSSIGYCCTRTSFPSVSGAVNFIENLLSTPRHSGYNAGKKFQ